MNAYEPITTANAWAVWIKPAKASLPFMRPSSPGSPQGKAEMALRMKSQPVRRYAQPRDVSEEAIGAGTLAWQEGMADWQP